MKSFIGFNYWSDKDNQKLWKLLIVQNLTEAFIRGLIAYGSETSSRVLMSIIMKLLMLILRIVYGNS